MRKHQILILLVILLGSSAYAQNKPTENKKTITTEFAVAGVCGMCEKRIEKAALIKGVKMAEWDKDTGIIKVIFKSKKTSVEAIQKAISEVGHDTPLFKTEDAVYKELPGCCAYKDGIETH